MEREASSNLARYDGVRYGHRTAEKVDNIVDLYSRSRAEGFGEEVQRRIMLGTYTLSSGYHDAYYNKALKVRRLIKNDFDAAFERCDVLLCPTAPTTASRTGEKTAWPPDRQRLTLTPCASRRRSTGGPAVGGTPPVSRDLISISVLGPDGRIKTPPSKVADRRNPS